MPAKRFLWFIALILLGCAVNARASTWQPVTEGALDFVTGTFLDTVNSYAEPIKRAATRLFWLLLSLSIVWIGCKRIFMPDNIQDLTAVFLRLVVVTGVFLFLLQNGAKIGGDIIDSLISLTDDRRIGPAEMFDLTANLFVRFTDLISNADLSILGSLMLSIPCWVFFYFMTKVIVRFTVLYLTAYSLCVCGIFVLGFGSFAATRNIAVNYLRGIIASALQLMTTILICNAGHAILIKLAEQYETMERTVQIQDCIAILFSGMFILGLVETLPEVVGALMATGANAHAPLPRYGVGQSVRYVSSGIKAVSRIYTRRK